VTPSDNSTPPRPDSPDGQRFTPEQRKILLVSFVVAFLSLLSVSIVNVVLPSIESSMEASSAALQWILSGYALAFGVVLVAAGRAGDIFGRGRLFVIGLILFGLGSLSAGLAGDPLWLNVSRVVMGLGSGFLNPQVTGLIQQYFKGAQRGTAFGLFGGVIGVSVAVGPVLGGVLIALLGPEWGWRAAFLINVPFVVLGLAGAFFWLPGSAWRPVGEATQAAAGSAASADAAGPGASAARRGGRLAHLDPVGVLLLSAGILLIMLPFVEREVGALIWFSLLAGAAFIAVWLWWERRFARTGREPMVDLALFRTRTFANGAMLITVYFMGMTSVWVLLALWMQQGLGHTALAAGMIGLPSAAVSAVLSPIAGRHVTRVGRPMVLWGVLLALTGIGLTALAVVLHYVAGTSEWWLLGSLAVLGSGQSLVVGPNQTLTLAEVPIRYAGSAGGVLQTGQRVGTSIGIAMITGIVFSMVATAGWATAFAVGLGVIAVFIAVAGVVGLFDLRQGRRAAGSGA
jgi:MFS family permease